MLFVGGIGGQRDGRLPHRPHQRLAPCTQGLRRSATLAQPPPQQMPDPGTDGCIRQPAALGPVNQSLHRPLHLPVPGPKAPVRNTMDRLQPNPVPRDPPIITPPKIGFDVTPVTSRPPTAVIE